MMWNTFFNILGATCFFASITGHNANEYSLDEKLVFHDDFSTFDFSTWKHEITMGGGGNWEFEMYVNSRDNSYVRDGVLFLKPTLTEDKLGKSLVEGSNPNWQENTVDLWGTGPANLCTGNQFYGCYRTGTPLDPINPIQSARIRTAESFSFRYGRIEVRAALPKGKWLWPAIWMLPKYEVYGPWPASGEIDIMESRGNPEGYSNAKGQPLGCNTVGSTVHWGPAFNHDAYPLSTSTVTHHSSKTAGGDCPFSSQYHTFGMIWSPENLTFYVDQSVHMVVPLAGRGTDPLWERGVRNKYWKEKAEPGDQGSDGYFQNPWRGGTKSAPFDQEFFIVLNLAVGGISGGSSDSAYWPDGRGGKPWVNEVPPGSASAAAMFLQSKNEWLPTWRGNATRGQTIGESASMRIDDIRVWSFTKRETYVPLNLNVVDSDPTFQKKPFGKNQSMLLWTWGLIWLFIGSLLGVSIAKLFNAHTCPCIKDKQSLQRSYYGTVRF